MKTFHNVILFSAVGQPVGQHRVNLNRQLTILAATRWLRKNFRRARQAHGGARAISVSCTEAVS